MSEPIFLQLIGSPVLRIGGGRPIELRQKAYAIAALLYLDYHSRARRPVVAERVWEHSKLEQAMTNMRQTLLHTRGLEAQHGFTLFNSDSINIELNRDIVLDLREIGRLRTVTDGAELEQLVGLYRGDLLDGLSESGPELSQWLRTARSELEDRYITQGTEVALRIGGPAALSALSRMSEQLPYSEEVVRALIRVHLKQGEETMALGVYKALERRLEREMGNAPAPETAALLHQAPPPRPSAQIYALPRVAEIATRTARGFVPRIVLLPPLQEHKPVGMRKHLGSALIEDVTIRLTRLRSLSVIAPHTAWNLDPFSALDDARSHQIDYAVESRIAPDFTAESLSIGIRLVRIATREIVWADKFAFTPGLAPELYWDFANGIARALADNIEASELAHERTVRDANAYGHYLDGRHHLRSFDLPQVRRGRKSLRLARDIDPEQASIEGALARTYVIEWVLRSGSDRALLDKARLHAERAVAIDPNDGTAYRELGRAALFDRDLDLSLVHMERAALLAPHHADILADYADTLVHNSQHAAAQEKIEEALRLNPVPPDEYHWTFAGVTFLRGRFEDTLVHLNQMRNPEPAMRLMAAAAAMAGDLELARKSRLLVLEQQPDFTIARWTARMPQRSPDDVELYIEALRRAGFK